MNLKKRTKKGRRNLILREINRIGETGGRISFNCKWRREARVGSEKELQEAKEGMVSRKAERFVRKIEQK
jgi:hypothetical protein